jgi:putative flippase GtrA
MKKDFFTKLFFYILIGVYGVLLDAATFAFFYDQIFVKFLHINMSAPATSAILGTIAATMSGVVGLTNNFIMNDHFVYKKEWHHIHGTKRFMRYFVAVLLGTFLIGKVIIFNIVFSLTGNQNGVISNIISIGVGTFINYPINYFWTWGNFSVKEKLRKKA